MIIAYIIIGSCMGLAAALIALLAGAPIWLAVLAYSLMSTAGVFLAAVIFQGTIQLLPERPRTSAQALGSMR